MSILTREELHSLSPDEQALALSLGLCPWRRRKKSHFRCTSGDNYVLVTTTKCRLCSAEHIKVFEMVKDGSVLYSREIDMVPSEKELGDRSVKNPVCSVRHCSCCKSYLSSFNKEALIDKFLSYVVDGRNFLV